MARILIVDDDEDIRLTMRALLEDLGRYTVLEAVDGIDALAQLQSNAEPLVVLLDVLMPGLDGIGVLEAVAANEVLASRHAFILDSVSRRLPDLEFPAALAIPVQVIAKPFDINELLDAVAEAEQQLRDRERKEVT